MKPRLYVKAGLWRCCGGGIYGMGYDPKHAYEDWFTKCVVQK